MAAKVRGGRRIGNGLRVKRVGFRGTKKIDKLKMLAKVKQVLADEQIEVLLWYYYDGMEMHEIGELLNCGQKAVARRLDRIDARLKKHRLPLPRRLEHPTTTDHVDCYNLMED
jgi:hypothetical protein